MKRFAFAWIPAFAGMTSITAIVVLIGVLAVFSGCKDSGRQAVAAVGQGAPDFTLRDVDGNVLGLSDMKGSVALINFWATWCRSCKAEMPSLQALYDGLKGDSRFHLISVLYRDDPLSAAMYMKQNGYSFPLFPDPDGAVSAAYGLTGVPETFVVDKKGVLRKKMIGPVDFSSPEAVAYLRELAEE